MDEQGVARTELAAQLPARLQERLRFDIAHRTPDFDQRDIETLGTGQDTPLDLVGDVRDYLYRATEIIATTLAPQHLLVDLAGGEVVATRHAGAHETLVMPEIEVGFGAVLGHEHLPVLERAHGAGVDIDVGVELEQRHAQTARFENRRQRGRGKALAQRGNHTTRDEDQARHAKPCKYRYKPGLKTQSDAPRGWEATLSETHPQLNRKRRIRRPATAAMLFSTP